MNTDDFLRRFEQKLNFQSLSADTRTVSVDFFLSHILPQVQVIAVRSPFETASRGELGGILEICTVPKVFDETWFEGDTNSTTRILCTVIFYGIGFPSDQYSGSPREDQRNILYYRCVWLDSHREELPTILAEEVNHAIQEAQEGIHLWLKCQGMSAEEIERSMGREFSNGWLEGLEIILAQIVVGGTRQAHGGTLSSILFPLKEDSEFSPYYDPYYEFEDYYELFLKLNQDKSSAFKNGGISALRIQKQQFEQILQGEILLVDFLKTIIQDILTISKSRGEKQVLCPEFLTRGYLQAEPQLITLVFDDRDRPSPVEYLRQFEKKLNFQPLPSITRKEVSTDVLINHILPQVVILLTDYAITDEDGTRYWTIVTISKEEYKALLAGKLRDTIVFQGLIFDGLTRQKRKLDSFHYYPSDLSDHISGMAERKFELVEVEAVSNIIQTYIEEN